MASNEESDDFCRMQHLIDEMDRSNQRIDLFSENFDMEGLSHKATMKRPSPLERHFDVLLDEACRSEESDGASLQEIQANHPPKDVEDSGCEEVISRAIADVSKDFLAGLQTSGTQNHLGDSDESRISSDSDFKLICGMPSYARYPETAAGLSDTDWNPYGTESDNNQSPHLQSAPAQGTETKSYASSPFQPILSSTGLNAITPNSGDRILSVNSQSHLGDIREVSERESTLHEELKPDVSSHQSRIHQKVDWAITPKRVHRESSSSAVSQNFKEHKHDVIMHYNSGTIKASKDDVNTRECTSSDEEKKMIASTSSTGYSSGTSGVKTNVDVNREHNPPQHMSVFERAKLMGIPEDILFDRPANKSSHHINGKSWNGNGKAGGLSDYDSDDHLGKKIQHILSETSHLSNGVEKANNDKASIDYNLLQRDLQEIQDSLESLSSGSPAERFQDWRKQEDNSLSLSDKEGDTPSTSSTPKISGPSPVWDFAEVIGSLANRIETNKAYPSRSGIKKMHLNSDGDETRSSDSSHKSDDFISLTGRHQSNVRGLHTSHDVDQMLSTFQNQRHQLESRYQQLSNQGLADKVFRILTNQDPESQANGILSEVSAEEKQLKAKLAVKQHNKDFNFSSNSSILEDSHPSFGLPDDVRKRLDLSAISSVDSSKVFDRSSFTLPASSKGFSAFDDAKKLLSSQMAKVSERTFNHSLEMKYPQTIQCYPLLMDKSDRDEGGKRELERYASDGDASEEGANSNGSPEEDCRSTQPLKDQSDQSPQVLSEKEKHESPTSSDPGAASRPKEKYRPYRPLGSKEVYYTESDTASVADSVTTMESTHLGSDDASGPHLPPSAYGSRKDAPNVAGIYGNRKNLSTVQEAAEPSVTEEKSHREDEGCNSNQEKVINELSSRLKQQGLSSHKDDSSGRSGRDVTTQRYNTSIWARRDERTSNTSTEKKNEKPEQMLSSALLSHGEPDTASHSVSAARRNARWANRVEEMSPNLPNAGRSNVRGDLPVEATLSQRPSTFSDRDFVDSVKEKPDHTALKENFTLPTNAFVSERGINSNEDRDREPMSLRIKLAYTDTNRKHEEHPQRRDISEKGDDRLRSHLRDEGYDYRSSERSHHHSCEPFTYSQNLVRSLSDENLNSSQRDVRLSPAFRRALSPELLNSIGSRSPLLGRTIERSLAQPPSEYPSHSRSNYSTSVFNQRPYSLSDPPTFLARERSFSPRERSFSPREYTRSPTNENFRPHLSPTQARTSPFLSFDMKPKIQTISPSGRQHAPEKRLEDSERYRYRQLSPTSFQKRQVELTLEDMSSASEADSQIDLEPISRRAQLLKDALSHEREPNLNPDINALWEQFKAYNESDDSSINTARMEAVADLLKSPSTHLVSQYLKEREEYRIERQERVEREKEKRLKEQVKAHKSSSSEDEFNERYHELLAAKEEERLKRRSAKKKKGRNGSSAKISEPMKDHEKKQKNKCTDSLYSIPEDRSFEQSPAKSLSGSQPRQNQNGSSQPNMIDPNMFKLREKISRQRTKVNRDMMKEMIRIEKLQKLEQLLKAKRRGEITNQMLEQQLEELSSTSQTISDHSQENMKHIDLHSRLASDDSTTAKDSSGEMHMWKMRKEDRQKDLERVASEQRDKVRVKSSNNNKENKPRHDRKHPSKESSHRSEIKLLKLVTEGYLTAEEAYRVALARTEPDASQTSEDMSVISSENNGSFSSHRPHRFYSPYTRSHASTSQIKHVPKLKFSDRLDDTSLNGTDYWQGKLQKQAWKEEYDFGDIKSDSHLSQYSKPSFDQGPQRANRNTKFMQSAPVSYKRERGRPRSQSPFSSSRQRSAGQRKVVTSGHQSPLRSHSSSPSRRTKDASIFSCKGKHSYHSHGKKYQSERDSSMTNKEINRSVAWHIDMNSPPDQWNEPQPLQEIPLSTFNKRFPHGHSLPNSDSTHKDTKKHPMSVISDHNIWRKSHHPQGIPKLQWEHVVSQDSLASKTNHWQVDPIMDRVQYILNKPTSSVISDQSSFTSQKAVDCAKSLSKFSLQDAFLQRKQDFISKCRERQKRLALAKEDRQMQECLRLEREAIFAEQERMGAPNVYAHPYSDNLHHPKRRLLTKQEMKEMTARKYKNLPEVIEKKEENRRKIEYKLNRLRANLFNKKVQREVLKKRFKQRG